MWRVEAILPEPITTVYRQAAGGGEVAGLERLFPTRYTFFCGVGWRGRESAGLRPSLDDYLVTVV